MFAPQIADNQGQNRIRLLATTLRRAFVALAFLVLTVPAVAEDASRIANFTLGNGMEVVVIPDRRAPVVTHMVWYRIGSADEPPGKSGIAHFFEHLMFKATKNHRAGEFDRRVSEIGGSANAFTSDDYTAYFQTVSPDALPTMMAYESDRMRNLILTDDVIATERDVILEERGARVDNDPGSLLSEEVDATLYQNHPYRIPVIGWKHEIEQLNRIDAIEFYDRYYAPNNAILVVAGDVTPERVKELAEQTYGKIARGPDLPPRARPQEPQQNTSRTVTLVDQRVSVPSFSKRWVVPSYRTAEKGEAEALDLLSEILGGGSRSRLYQRLIVQDGTASSAGAFYDGAMYDATAFGVYGAPQGGDGIAEIEKTIDAEIARIVKDGVTEDELDRAKTRFRRGVIFARDNSSGMANLYGSALSTGSTLKDIDEWPQRIQAVTAAQVQAVAAKYLVPDISVSGYLLPSPEAAQ